MNAASSTRPAAYLQLAGWITLTAVVAALGASASVHAAAFYAQLDRPGWAPPGWLFGPVWSALYLMMAVAAWRVGRTGAPGAAPAQLLYLAQLAVNALWSWLFFAWHLGAAAFACIVVLWLMIAATVVLFGRRERLAAMLLLPYLAWVSFAGVLCFSVWQRNPALL
ncbi:tryptophan-rich sensory protein [Duganella sp. LX20W]|uniref:Tryptophan-rich sensory protein n=1 Tax=Rugamonas brunnea TaxID=2758569 RepID=A0A7W2ICI1_9BURK|nr:TspO/MBR family protein [Rugamonas brunnea]MBA5638263.1 tryptophan-rich sensory protein [Rugamonas brunnea]